MKLFLFVVGSATSYRLQRIFAQHCVDRGHKVAFVYDQPPDALFAQLQQDARPRGEQPQGAGRRPALWPRHRGGPGRRAAREGGTRRAGPPDVRPAGAHAAPFRAGLAEDGAPCRRHDIRAGHREFPSYEEMSRTGEWGRVEVLSMDDQLLRAL